MSNKEDKLGVEHNVQPTKEKKIKVLWYSDFLCRTGFGNVAQSIMKRLLATGKYEFKVIAINHSGKPYNETTSPYYDFKDVAVYPANDNRTQNADFLGKAQLSDAITNEEFDLLFVLQDTFNLVPFHTLIQEARAKKDKPFKYVFYFPCDGAFKDLWVTNAIATADYPVVYTNYGKNEIAKIAPELAEKTDIIYHGFDSERFKVLPEEERQTFRKEFFKCGKDTIVVTNVNRNQPRKDLVRSIDAFVKFNKKFPNSKYYIHCFAKDPYGFALDDYLIKYYTPEERGNIMFPNADKMAHGGFPESFMNYIYGASDMLISTTLGEGWGLSATEAMACETPIIIPNNTSAPEIVGENEERGYLAESGNESITIMNDNEHRRPLTDVNSLVEKMCHVANNPEEAKAKAKVGRQWLNNYSWDSIAEKFDKIFEGAYCTLLDERKKTQLDKLVTADEKIAKEKLAYSKDNTEETKTDVAKEVKKD